MCMHYSGTQFRAKGHFQGYKRKGVKHILIKSINKKGQSMGCFRAVKVNMSAQRLFIYIYI